MKKVQTKSGFVCEVDERKVADWDFVCGLVDLEDENESKRVKALRFVIEFLLGPKQAASLADHIKDKDGIKNIANMLSEFKEILVLLGDDVKKSKSSQE